MQRHRAAVIMFLAGALSILVGWQTYYKAVYDTCVRMSAVNGQVTSFDLLQCREMEQRARDSGWMFQEMP